MLLFLFGYIDVLYFEFATLFIYMYINNIYIYMFLYIYTCIGIRMYIFDSRKLLDSASWVDI